MKLQEAVSQIIAAMDETGLEYMLVGSFSVHPPPKGFAWRLGSIEAWIPTPEDVIIQKLIWHRSKDLEDVLGVIAVNYHQLDQNYLRQWADRLNLRQALDDVWALAIEARE